jgi:hypothetical protein
MLLLVTHLRKKFTFTRWGSSEKQSEPKIWSPLSSWGGGGLRHFRGECSMLAIISSFFFFFNKRRFNFVCQVTILSWFIYNYECLLRGIVTSLHLHRNPLLTYVQNYFSQTPYMWSRDNAVGIATGYWPNGRGVGVRVPVASRIFSSPRRPDWLWGPPSLLSNRYGELLPLSKAATARSWPLTSN